MQLVPVKTDEQVEWLRQQRNRPELYKYFRQDKPITEREQKIWWRTLIKDSVRLFIVEKQDGTRIGYVGFNPFNAYASKAEFGIFIIPECSGKGYGTEALKMLLKKGFQEYRLSCIYSDMLDYPKENRFGFYHQLGFVKYAPEFQNVRYRKQGNIIPSIRFYMTRDRYEDIYGKADQGELGHKLKRPVGRPRKEVGASSGVHSSQDVVNAASK